MHNQLFSIFDKLISIPSVSTDIGSLNTCAEYILAFFKTHSNAYIKFITHNNKPSIIVQNYIGQHADIILNGHFDVVPADSDKQFHIEENNGKIYARGAGDMKAGVAILITLMQTILTEKYLDKKIMLMLTSDEEIGGFDGVGYLVDQGYTGDVILCPDGGSSINNIVYAEKGIYTFDLSAQGISCHSSKPWQGENAIVQIIDCYTEIKKTVEEFDSAYLSAHHWGTTVNLNIITGGSARNILPGMCKGSLDIRFTETYSSSALKGIIYEIIQRHNCNISTEFIGELLFTETTHPILQKYKSIADKHLGISTEREAEPGGSDGRFFAAKGGVVILHKPSSGNLHGKDEWVEKNDIQKIRDIFYDFIKS